MTLRFSSVATDLSVSRHDLLGGWRGVMEDVRRLSAQFRSSPGVCACGHKAPSGGTCPCCQSGTPHTECGDCTAQVNALGVAIGTLIDETLRFLPVLRDILEARAAVAESDHLTSVRSRIFAVEAAFRRLASASAEFGQGCKASHTKVVGAVVEDLLREVWELEELLEPGVKRWAELKPPPQRS